MNVKRYIAKDEQEALSKIRQELGRDAIILHTRKIKQKGVKGWFSKPLVEVVAAVEVQEKSVPKKPALSGAYNAQHQDYLREATQALLVEKARALELEKKEPQSAETDKIHSEIDALKDQIQMLTEMVKQVVSPAKPKEEPIEVQASNELPIHATKSAQDIFCERLKMQMVNQDHIEHIRSLLDNHTTSDSHIDIVTAKGNEVLKSLIGNAYRIEKRDAQPQIYFFIGPTGVGKTTTLAKIAAKLSLIEGKRVGLITSDTYRISAVDQLKTYSEILNIPLEVIYEPDELESILKRFQDRDFILIDTAGRNHKSPELKTDLLALIQQAPQAEVFLVMSLTTSARDIDSILESYSFIDQYELILTKLDEAATYGNILNARLRSQHPIAFLTDGQSVPDDIAIADADKIVNMLVGG